MEKKSIYVIIIAAVLVIAAVGAYFFFVNNGKENDPNKITFQIRDSDGVYFWIDGSGETAQDALIDAFKDYPEGTLVTSNFGISSMFGKGTEQLEDGSYQYWMQFIWKDNSWQLSDLTLINTASNSVDYILIIYAVYVDDNTEPPEDVAVPNDAKVWNGSSDGTVFTIASASGLYFKVNGNSNVSLIEAFKSACSTYNIPFVPSYSSTYGEGIEKLFGFGFDEETWDYWAQANIVNGNWTPTEAGMASLKSEDNPSFLIYYGQYGIVPDNIPT